MRITYLHTDQLERQLRVWREQLLACVTFAPHLPQEESIGASAPLVQVNTPLLDPPQGMVEVWCVAQPVVASGQQGSVRYRYNGDLLFGSVALHESAFTQRSIATAGTSPLQLATQQAFQEIFGLIDTFDYPYLLRVWNYFPSINAASHGLERYRQFNRGRQEGFVACGRSLEQNTPAASALGTVSGPLVVYFIAGRAKPVAIENPRQVSAYHYPEDYGSRSPTFARASLGRVGEQEVLFISGTASIVGHRSMHRGDVVAQTRETLANIAAVVAEANRITAAGRYHVAQLSYKVYLRHAKDIEVIRHELVSAFGPKVDAIYLEAEICRQELLVEIEAIAGVAVEKL